MMFHEIYDMSDFEAYCLAKKQKKDVLSRFETRVPNVNIIIDISKLSRWKAIRVLKAITDLQKVDGIRVTKIKKLEKTKHAQEKKLC